MKNKNVLFLTGTRSEYGKLRPLIHVLHEDVSYNVIIFITGMHLNPEFGNTYKEVIEDFNGEIIYNFNNNVLLNSIDCYRVNAFSYTFYNLSKTLFERNIDLLVIHGDRTEALAGAVAGRLYDINVAHIEGGEISGNVDEVFRHSITKLSQFHFVSNTESYKRLMQLGEDPKYIYIIGSPEIDYIMKKNFKRLEDVKRLYNIGFQKYSILIYHPNQDDQEIIAHKTKELIEALKMSGLNYIIIYPNDEPGSELIINEYQKLENKNFLIYKSIDFESFQTLYQYCDFIIGNSSAGVRNCGIFKKKCINLGDRQLNRHIYSKNIVNIENETAKEILDAINNIDIHTAIFDDNFGKGDSAIKFSDIIAKQDLCNNRYKKQFKDIDICNEILLIKE